MLTGEFPIVMERSGQIRSVRHQALLALIQCCLERRKEDRPTASDVIVELDSKKHKLPNYFCTIEP